MMHECPRCGFTQPKDRYCANCGLDIDNYVPAPKPFYKRMAESTGFQIALAVLIVIGLGTWIYLSQQKAVEQRLKAAMEQQMENAPATATGGFAAQSDNVEPSAKAVQEGTTFVPAPTVAMNAQPSATATSAVKRVTELNVHFLQLSRLFVAQLAEENQVVDETATTRSIVIAGQPSVNSLRGQDPHFEQLPGSDTHSLQAGRTITLDFMHMVSGPNDLAGMEIEISAPRIDRMIELAVTGSAVLKTLEGNISSFNFDGRYTIPADSTLLIAGALPHVSSPPEMQDIFSNTPLVILFTPEFMNQTSELVLFIQPK